MVRALPAVTHRALRRVRPLRYETNASYITRVAGAHHLLGGELLDGLSIGHPRLHPDCEQPRGPRSHIDLYLNAPARERFSRYVQIPENHLAHALPDWTGYHRDQPYSIRPRTLLWPSYLPAVTGCPHCTRAHTGQPEPVLLCLPHHRLVCARHQTWALGPHTLHGQTIDNQHASLQRTPEIITAHHTHQRLLSRHGAHQVVHAVSLAMQFTEYWRRNAPADERIWPARARRISPSRRRMWYALAREAITYPETIALAQLLIRRPYWPLHRPGQPHPLHEAAADLLDRPWLNDPAHHPSDLINRIGPPSRHPSSSPWPYRHSTSTHHDNTHSTELTRLGYQPPLPTRKTTGNSGATAARTSGGPRPHE